MTLDVLLLMYTVTSGPQSTHVFGHSGGSQGDFAIPDDLWPSDFLSGQPCFWFLLNEESLYTNKTTKGHQPVKNGFKSSQTPRVLPAGNVE